MRARSNGLFGALVAGLWLAGCAHVSEDAMSAEAHRAEAQEHEQRAAYARGKYQAEAPPVQWISSPELQALNAVRPSDGGVEYLRAADEDSRCASEHRAAAAALERSEEKECAAIPAEERVACPLLATSVSRVEELPQALLLKMRPQVDTARMAQRMRCHLSFARSHGFGVPSCPLYLKGISIRQISGDTLRIDADSPGTAQKLREEVRAMFVREPHVSSR